MGLLQEITRFIQDLGWTFSQGELTGDVWRAPNVFGEPSRLTIGFDHPAADPSGIRDRYFVEGMWPDATLREASLGTTPAGETVVRFSEDLKHGKAGLAERWEPRRPAQLVDATIPAEIRLQLGDEEQRFARPALEVKGTAQTNHRWCEIPRKGFAAVPREVARFHVKVYALPDPSLAGLRLLIDEPRSPHVSGFLFPRLWLLKADGTLYRRLLSWTTDIFKNPALVILVGISLAAGLAIPFRKKETLPTPLA